MIVQNEVNLQEELANKTDNRTVSYEPLYREDFSTN